MKSFFFIFLFLSVWLTGLGQSDTVAPPQQDTSTTRPAIPERKRATRRGTSPPVRDSVRIADSTKRVADSLGMWGIRNDTLRKDSTVADTVKKADVALPQKFTGIDSMYAHFLQNPYLPVHRRAVYQIVKVRELYSKDELFYMVAGLVLFLAFIKLVFSRYFRNIFRLFFQPSFRQKQTREQLMQSSLPSLMLNLFFLVSAGTYIALLIQYYNLLPLGFWWLLLYSTITLCVLYVSKFILLSFSGWVFNVKEATDTYMFVVYLINKILGILLLPFILILAFSQPEIINISVTICMLLVILLFIYRYVVSYAPVRREVKVSPLHFVMYIFAFEIAPLLLIYKTVILYLARTL